MHLRRADIIKVLRSIDVETNAGKRDVALLSIGWSGALRVEELANLTRNDVKFTDGGLRLELRRSDKSNVETITIRNSATKWNPVNQLRTWLEYIDEHSPTPTGIWLPINKADNLAGLNGMKPGAIYELARRRFNGVAPEGSTVKSLRKGWITQAIEDGQDLRGIHTHSRNKQLATTWDTSQTPETRQFKPVNL